MLNSDWDGMSFLSLTLAEKIEEVDADESYSPEEGRRIYEQYLNEEE